MKRDKILLLFSLILLTMIGLSVASAADDSSMDDSLGLSMDDSVVTGGNDGSFLKVDSCSSLKYSLGDSENNDLDDSADLNNNGTDDSASGNSAETDSAENCAETGSTDLAAGENNGSLANETIDFSNRSDNIFLVTPENFNIFFDEQNVLRELYGGCTLVFEGNFTDMGIFDIAYPYTHIAARNDLFNNTGFRVSADYVELANLNIYLDKVFPDNDNAGILVLSDFVSIYNTVINYVVPTNSSGFAVYSEGRESDKVENLSLINNTFRFHGNNLDESWDYAIFLDKTDNGLVYGNKIDSYLPLRTVDWSAAIYGGVSREAVGTLVAQGCEFLRISGNEINSHVNGGVDEYPILDSLLIYDSRNVTIDQNKIYMEDIYTKKGKDNYLQGIDLYLCDDVTIVMNDIDVKTTGGKPAMGTAYPIQVNGPADNVKIAFNNLTTFNYGPNCGIYSHNFYGATHIDIISNFINVTGLASSHYHGLVAGIEVQDSNDLIWNNTIIVNNLGNYSSKNNVYGISYSQNIGGEHSYNIQFNNITTNGQYAVKLNASDSAVTNSVISNNVLNTNTLSANDAVDVKGNKRNVTINNNTDGKFKNVMKDSSYPEWLKNFLGHTGVETKDFIWVTTSSNSASNGTGFSNGTGNGSGLSPQGGDATIGNNTNGTDSLIDGNGTENGTGEGTAGNSTDVTDPSGEPGASTDGDSSAEGSGDGGDNDKAVEPVNPSEPVNPVDDEPINNTDPLPDVPEVPVNDTDSEPVNNTDPLPDVPVEIINDSDSEPINSTEPVNNTDSEPVNSTEPVNNTDSEPVNSTEATNQTETINNDTNQTIITEDDLDPKEPQDNPDDENPTVDDEQSTPGDSGEELADSEDPSNPQENDNSDTQEDSKDSEDMRSARVGDSHSASASSPGLSGASAANDAYELDKKVEDVVSKTIDYVSLAGICIAVLLLISVGYIRQKGIEEED